MMPTFSHKGQRRYLAYRVSSSLLLTVSLLLQLLVVSMYQGQLVLMESCHFPHLLQSVSVTQLTPTSLRNVFIRGRIHHQH